ncbi:FAD-dependent monooxygenase [Streptomyces sp. NPDC086080]|uniref:FAD-dependent monooxygenase n=1 Tax=Streptomyces sp. NPDC086080 TaxID=3365748 RepID=UPI0037D8983B
MAAADVQRHVVVVGGGIGGLTAAAALHRAGRRVTVLERADTLRPVGAGISLAPNALRALDVIGLGDEIRSLAAWQGEGGLRTPGGRWLSRTDSSAAAGRFGDPLVLLHRATLAELLAARLPEGAVRTASPATLTDPGEPGGRPALVDTPDGTLEADLVIGADGIRSGVRHTLFPAHPGPRYAGFTTWRAVVPAPERPFRPHETWGRGRIWGTQPLKDGRVYAYAAAARPEGERAPDERAELLRLFGDWHHPVPEILASVAPEDVLRRDVRFMGEPLPAYHRGRTALLGDAAHAMPPSMGQGGNQAIEDAVVLAHLVNGERTLRDALEDYTRERLPRTMEVVRRSARTGRMTMLENPAAVALRNAAVAAVGRIGPALALRAFDGIADWRPPSGTSSAGPRDTRSAAPH